MIPIPIIWRGWGIVVIGIVFITLLAGALLGVQLSLGRTAANVVIALTLVPAGVLTWLLGKRMNRNKNPRVIHPQTGQTVVIRNAHELFFIRVETWGAIMVVVGILWAVYLAFRTPTGI